jgi:CRP-like cAMP-binding protein
MCHGCSESPELAASCRELRAETLRAVHLFHDLPADLLATLLEGGGQTELASEQWIASAGDTARDFHLVLEGEIGLFHQSEEGDEFIVALVGPGELFGEDLALAPGARHALSARALQPSRVADFALDSLRQLLTRDNRLVARLLETLQRRNSILLEEIERVTVQSASERLVTFLLRQRSFGRLAATRLPKRILASRLSMRPETLSRILGKLKACQRLEEVDGCLFLTEEAPDADRCALCPARLWGCPGPASFGARPLRDEA